MAQSIAAPVVERNPQFAKLLMVGWIAAWTALGLLIGTGTVLKYLGRPKLVLWYTAVGTGLAVWRTATGKTRGTPGIKSAEGLVSGFASIFAFTLLALSCYGFYKITFWLTYLADRLFSPAILATRVGHQLGVWVSVVISALLGMAFVLTTADTMARQLIDDEGQKLFHTALYAQRAKAFFVVCGMAIGIFAWWHWMLQSSDEDRVVISLVVMFIFGAFLNDFNKETASEAKPIVKEQAVAAVSKLLKSRGLEVHALSQSSDPYSAGIDLLAVGQKLAVAAAVLGAWTKEEAKAPGQLKSATFLREAGWTYVRRYFSQSVSGLRPVLFLVEVPPAPELVNFAGENDIAIQAVSAAMVTEIEVATPEALSDLSAKLLPDGLIGVKGAELEKTGEVR